MQHKLRQVVYNITVEKEYFYALSVILLMVAGLFLRLDKIGNYSFWVDEYNHVYAAINILENGKPLLPSGESYYRGLPYTLLVSLSFVVFGINELSARLPSVISGVLLILVVYIFARRLFNRNVAIFSAILVTFTPSFVKWSQVCRMYSLWQLFLVACLYYLYRFTEEERKRKLNSFFLVLFFSLSFFTHIGTFLIIPAMGLCLVVLLISEKDRIKRKLALHRYPFVFGMGGILLASVLLVSINFDRFVYEITHHLHHVWTAEDLTSMKDKSVFQLLDFNIIEVLFKEHPLLFIISIFGVLYSLRYEKKKVPFLIIFSMIPLFFIVVFHTRQNIRYFLPFYSFYIILQSYIVVFLASSPPHFCRVVSETRTIKNKFVNGGARFFIMPSIAVSLVVLGLYENKYAGKPPLSHLCSNWKMGCDYLSSHLQKEDVVMTNRPVAVNYYCKEKSVDYTLRDNSLTMARKYEDDKGNCYEGYTDTRMIDDLDEFLEILRRNDNGWIIWNDSAQRHVPNEIREFTESKLERHVRSTEHNIWVYGWQVFRGKSVSPEKLCLGKKRGGRSSTRALTLLGCEIADMMDGERILSAGDRINVTLFLEADSTESVHDALFQLNMTLLYKEWQRELAPVIFTLDGGECGLFYELTFVKTLPDDLHAGKAEVGFSINRLDKRSCDLREPQYVQTTTTCITVESIWVINPHEPDMLYLKDYDKTSDNSIRYHIPFVVKNNNDHTMHERLVYVSWNTEKFVEKNILDPKGENLDMVDGDGNRVPFSLRNVGSSEASLVFPVTLCPHEAREFDLRFYPLGYKPSEAKHKEEILPFIENEPGSKLISSGSKNIRYWSRESVRLKNGVHPVYGNFMHEIIIDVENGVDNAWLIDGIECDDDGIKTAFYEDSYLEYDIYGFQDSSVRASVQAMLPFFRSTRHNHGEDQNGLGGHWKTDTSVFSLRKWYHRKISMKEFCGKKAKKLVFMFAGKGIQVPGRHIFYFDNIRITRGQEPEPNFDIAS